VIILGLNAWHPDAAAALIIDGKLVGAVEEERFTRVKHFAGFPSGAVAWCLAFAGVRPEDIDHVAIPRDPFARVLRKAWFALRAPRFAAGRARAAGRALDTRGELARALGVGPERIRARMHRVEHHRAHLACAFFGSPFDRAAVLSLDGLGDFASGSWGVGEGSRLRITGSAAFPHSLGLAYSAVTQFLGFREFGDEYKVMGLAAYGAPDYAGLFRQMLSAAHPPSYRLALDWFTHHRTGPSLTWEAGAPVQGRLFGPRFAERLGPAREPADPLDDRHRAIAASLQARFDEIVGAALGAVAHAAGSDAVAYAGGVALNCVANGRAMAVGAVERLYVPPAPGDAGLAVGAALHVWHERLGGRRIAPIEHAFWGSEHDAGRIAAALAARGLAARRPDEEMAALAAGQLAEGRVVGWFQGRMEFGPRALGARSILADPRRPDMRERLNERIKRRESFRPFAPAVMAERAGAWFEHARPSPFMLLALPVLAGRRREIPAPIHVDGTGRLQTVTREANPGFWSLLQQFERRTGVPVLLNTSFNEHEPIVETPENAIDCFVRTGMDALAIGPFFVTRPEQAAR
jgi:carbamoyltransferase